MIGLRSKGNFNKTENHLKKLLRGDIFRNLDQYGEIGVRALASATPVRTGLAAHSWGYRVTRGKNPRIEWFNTDIESGVSVVILIQYGHATKDGGWVEGRDFINPAMRHVFDQIADDVWKKVTND